MNQRDPQATRQRLLEVVRDLYTETEGLSADDGDLQLWYNRGYADGMLRVLRQKEPAERLSDLPDTEPGEIIAGQEFLPWGKAYRHGLEMGEKETREVL
jgi:hypothetical protein